MAHLKPKDVAIALKMHDLGCSCREIGEALGVSPQAISRHLRKRGIETNVGGYCEKRSQVAEKHERILTLHGKGQSMSAIARELGMSFSGVAYVVKKAEKANAGEDS